MKRKEDCKRLWVVPYRHTARFESVRSLIGETAEDELSEVKSKAEEKHHRSHRSLGEILRKHTHSLFRNIPSCFRKA